MTKSQKRHLIPLKIFLTVSHLFRISKFLYNNLVNFNHSKQTRWLNFNQVTREIKQMLNQTRNRVQDFMKHDYRLNKIIKGPDKTTEGCMRVNQYS
jgi:hypothetical protein